jgi:hypothetical protein
MVDPPPLPPPAPPGAATPPAVPQAAAVRTVAESMTVPVGTQLVVRLAIDINSSSASVGDRFQGFLDIDVAADGRLVAPRGGAVYGMVTAVERNKALSVALTDMKVGERVLPVQTQPVRVQGKSVVIRAQSPQAFTLAVPLQVDLMTNVAVR